MWVAIVIAACIFGPVKGQLPGGCVPLHDKTFSTGYPGDYYEPLDELQDVIPVSPRVSTWAGTKPIPTQHFAINQAKGGAAPIRQVPYSIVFDTEGMTFDAYTMDRWSDPARSDEMQQQTPSVEGEPWNKVTSVGTNMKQVVTGPDANPYGMFTGRSGIKAGILGAGDPQWTDFGEMWANFLYTDIEGGTMEVPLVRGTPFNTFIVNNANPVLRPYCLDSIDGQTFSYSCPMEGNVQDAGDGFLEGTCSGGTAELIFRSSKPIDDLSLVQYAVGPINGWPANMVTCGPECAIDDDRREVRVLVPGMSGNLGMAINYIGKYVLPPAWSTDPVEVSCTFSMYSERKQEQHDLDIEVYNCDGDLCHYPSCEDIGGGSNIFTTDIVLNVPTEAEFVQIAADTGENWADGNFAPMISCSSIPEQCSVSPDGRTITYTNTFNSDTVKYALNVIGRFVKPSDWQNNPYAHDCSDEPPPQTTSDPDATTPSTPETTAGPTVDPGFCGEDLSLPPCPFPFCKQTFCANMDNANHYFKLVIQLGESIKNINEVQIAMNTPEGWQGGGNGMITCTSDVCSLDKDGTELIYCTTVPTGPIWYAVNIIGRFIQPPTDWQSEPFRTQCGGSGIDLGVDNKFVLELNEPGTRLPDQTRKYVAYFSQPVRGEYDADGLKFTEPGGEPYTGLMQVGYIGAGPRGDTSQNDFLDEYAGVFPYKPETTYCVMEDGFTGYINHDWNKNDENGPTGNGDLLMLAFPHHEAQLSGTLLDTPFTYKGVVGDSWLLEEPLPHSTMEPDQQGVDDIKANPDRNQEILDAIQRDFDDVRLSESCYTGGTYWAGKDISMVARLASISRAFDTTHYQQLDTDIQNCLELMLRIDDSLTSDHQLRYDTVYGGVINRGVPNNEPISPGANFGFPIYADHHFHLGYWIYAASYLCLYNQAWCQTHRERLVALVRDVANPSTDDPYFPVARHKDWYIGISWATGVSGGQRQQESSSEAIACYHGVAALGYALGEQDMEFMGQLLLATEIRGTREYYHVRPHNEYYFPPHLKTYGVIGMFSEESIFMYTLNWPCDPLEFPMRHACLVGIQIIPITSISKYYMDQEWSNSVRDVCTWANDPFQAPGSELIDPEILRPVSTGWGAFCHAGMANSDEQAREAAADYLKDKSPRDLVSGTGAASTLLFIWEST